MNLKKQQLARQETEKPKAVEPEQKVTEPKAEEKGRAEKESSALDDQKKEVPQQARPSEAKVAPNLLLKETRAQERGATSDYHNTHKRR